MGFQKIARRHYGETATFGGVVEDARVIEIFSTRRNAMNEYAKGGWNLWTDTRIKGAFNFGRGTFADLREHAEMNRKYATFINLETGEVL